MDDLIIRTARLEDATDIAGLLRATRWFGRMESESPGDTSARILTHLRLCLSDDSHSVLVAVEVAGKVYGYLSVHWLPYLFLPGPEGFVSELFVHPDVLAARGSGSGCWQAVSKRLASAVAAACN